MTTTPTSAGATPSAASAASRPPPRAAHRMLVGPEAGVHQDDGVGRADEQAAVGHPEPAVRAEPRGRRPAGLLGGVAEHHVERQAALAVGDQAPVHQRSCGGSAHQERSVPRQPRPAASSRRNARALVARRGVRAPP